LGQVGPLPKARPLIRQVFNLRIKNNIHSKEKNKKNLDPCHQMLFLGSKYAKIAFTALPQTPMGSLCAPSDPPSRNIGASSKGKGEEGKVRKGRGKGKGVEGHSMA